MRDFHRQFDLEKLKNSEFFNSPVDVNRCDANCLLSDLKDMTYIRKVENKLALEKKKGNIKGPVHLGVGQEAIPVGIAKNISNKDYVFGAHRSHSHILSLATDLRKFFSEILGRSEGLSKGMGGSMHLIDKKCGFYGSVPIVAGTIPIALGAALAAKIQENKSIAVSYFGDGASEEGVFHESLNLSNILNCPILFVCENNLFSSHMFISERQPLSSIARFALANDINFKIIDGNNICEVNNAANELINWIRKSSKPAFIEAVTYRWYGHVDWREDIDVGVNRSEKDLKNWKKRDPIQRLINGLKSKDLFDEERYIELSNNLDSEISIAWDTAVQDPYPNAKESNNFVFK